jgi:hypothetical protein
MREGVKRSDGVAGGQAHGGVVRVYVDVADGWRRVAGLAGALVATHIVALHVRTRDTNGVP